ncbi:MAG TPA: TonB-dependent receptor [Chitinophagales bacterium]|nr:TonB-dependent receptor [Chitinophagales bacterium]
MKQLLMFFVLCFGLNNLYAQTTISGTVTDRQNEPLIGASIIIKGTTTGTITDFDGKFSFTVSETPPLTLVISYIGYQNTEIGVSTNSKGLEVTLEEESNILQEVVVSASRVQEKILESPVTIEKLDLQTIKASGSSDYFDQMTKLKGVSGASGSMTFNAINTRGFGGIANTRFVQLVDGIDNSAPLLNFPMGNLIGIGENDIKDVELVPGAASALYGPNAFNGIMLMTSKSPFDYEGLTVSFKQGFSKASNDKPNPMYNADVRYAKTFGKFGFKATGSYFGATDWKADDYHTDVVTKQKYNDELSLDANGKLIGDKPQGFNGVNTYGDEGVLSTVPLGALPAGHPTREALVGGVAGALAPFFGGDMDIAKGFINARFNKLPTVLLRRTGIQEEDLLENRNATSAKASLALHYKPTSEIDINYAFRFGHGNSVYQGSEKYVLRNFTSFSNKIEATGKDFMVRSYMTQTNAGDSYNMTALGSYTNELLAGTAAKWAPAYLGQIVGTYMGAALQNLGAGGTPEMEDALFKSPDLNNLANFKGRQAADALMPPRGSQAYNEAIQTIKGTLFQRSDPAKGILGGASFTDKSRLFHTEATYDFTSLLKEKVGILVGANHRMYSLFTDGTVFNEDPEGTGTNTRIKINEYGAFVQATKKVIDDRLRISASLRYDKNENFKGVLSPRVAVVGTMGDKRQHNVRAAFQTGFRNPDTQAQFIYFPASTLLMGGAKKNAERYGVYEGGAYTAASFAKFQGSALAGAPDPTLLEEFYMDYIKPEKLSSVEVGYKSVVKNLYIDWSAYYNWYKDFITQSNVVAKKSFTHKGAAVPGVETGAPTILRPYHNVEQKVTSWGTAIGLSYKMRKGFMMNTNYSYMDFSADGTDKNTVGFNSPSHIVNVGLANNNIANSNFGMSLSYRWQSEFYWTSSFGFGDIDAYGTFDASISYNVKKSNTILKMGATNIAGPSYTTNIGSPLVGRTFFVGITYDGSVLGGSKKKNNN